MEAVKDIWDIIDIIGTLISATLIPVAIFFVGHMYTKQKDKSDIESRQIDKISLFINHLTSENEDERIVALKISKYLHSKNQLPGELISAVETLSVTDGLSGALAADVLQQETKTDERFWEELKDLFTGTKQALNNYLTKDRQFRYIREISELNTQSRNLILINNEKIPLDLRQGASELVRHYTDWLAGYNKHLAQLEKEPEETTAFNYLAAPNFLYPKRAEEQFMEFIKQQAVNKA